MDVSQRDDAACESCGHDGTCECTCCPTLLADLLAVQIAYWRALAAEMAGTPELQVLYSIVRGDTQGERGQ